MYVRNILFSDYIVPTLAVSRLLDKIWLWQIKMKHILTLWRYKY